MRAAFILGSLRQLSGRLCSVLTRRENLGRLWPWRSGSPSFVLGEPWWLPPSSAIKAPSHACSNGSKNILKLPAQKNDSDRIEALQDIVDAIRIVDTKLKRRGSYSGRATTLCCPFRSGALLLASVSHRVARMQGATGTGRAACPNQPHPGLCPERLVSGSLQRSRTLRERGLASAPLVGAVGVLSVSDCVCRR